MNKIDFIIAVRDRSNERIQRCINSFKHVANNIFVVDYNSKTPIKVKDAKVIRKSGRKYRIWNKSHALNLGIKKCTSDYICTIDCDIILTSEVIEKIKNQIEMEKDQEVKSIIFNTNVRRILIKDIDKDSKVMLERSFPWFEEESRKNIYSAANGGIQIFSKDWIYKVGGYDEGLGIYWGAMDNRVYEQAKGLNVPIIDINRPMFHQEHQKRKEDNLDPEERDFAEKCASFKRHYLNELIQNGEYISTASWGEKYPNHEWMIGLVEEWIKYVEIEKKFDSKVYIALINNQEVVPINFLLNLVKIAEYAQRSHIKLIVRNIRAATVDSMRNLSVIEAIEMGCTHILQLDVDNVYPRDIIPRLLNHNKDFVCAPYNMRVPPYTNLQFKNVSLEKVNVPENVCNFSDQNDLVRIEGTGGAGTLIKTDVFKKIEYPYYQRPTKKKGNEYIETGEDIYFCRQCKKEGIEIWCDTSISYPHSISNYYIDKGKLVMLN